MCEQLLRLACTAEPLTENEGRELGKAVEEAGDDSTSLATVKDDHLIWIMIAPDILRQAKILPHSSKLIKIEGLNFVPNLVTAKAGRQLFGILYGNISGMV